ncbi:MAG: T9SS type A sorting domain-containing protein, partial [Bacteroidales bacterium]|nr:T9SS type A sorting domain-containing protein [Bacteroidales bacterium]
IYTIGGSSPDFSTISTAIDNLIIKGVDGAVIFNIATGTYAEQISIPEITGTSATNTITFQSATGDSTDVVINYAPTETYKDYTLLLNGVDYMIFKYVSIANNGASWGVPIEIRKEACFNSFESSKIYFSDDNTTSTLVYFGFDENNINYTDSNNVFNNCYFEKGKYAIDCYTSAYPKNTDITNNVFNNNMLRIYKGEAYNISKNHFNITATADNTMAVYSNDNSVFTNNMIYIDNSSNYADCYGIDSYGTNNEIYYNSIKIKGSGTPISTGENAIIKNNVLIADNSRCLNVGTNGSDIDYNTYYKTTVYNLINNSKLENWQQTTGFDMHSIYKNVNFISDTDLHTSDPWVNNKGTVISGITEDIDGNTRNTHPDIGACEFDGQMPLSGNYTIGSGGNFTTFGEAVDSLNFCGVDGYVTFKVLDGTYTEQFRLADTLIYRLPDTAQISFESQSADNSKVVLQYDAGAANNYVIYLDSVSNVNIKNLNIKALNQVNSVAVLMKECYKDTISGNIIEGNGQTMPVIYSSAPAGNENVIMNNTINNGKIGILLNNNTTNLSEHNYIIDNTFNNQYSGGVFAKYQKFALIERNQIYKTTAIEDTTWVGIGLISCDGSYSESGLTANNMISFNASDKSAGIHLYASNHQKIYYNSVNIFGNSNKSRAFNQESGGTDNDLKNNIFYNNSGGLVYYIANSNAFSSDYNDVLTNGSNFAYNAGTYITTKDDWLSSVNKDQNSVSVNPQYTADDDLHINELYLIGKGIPVAEVSKDIDGNIRDTEHPTIGADKIAGNCSGSLAGIYTIGTSGDYLTFNDAVTALLSCGVSGSVTFNVKSGTYDEQIYLPANIPGYTPNDSIVFQSETGNNTGVILQYNADSAKNYVVALDAAQNVHFKNMTIQAINTTYGRVVVLKDSVFVNFDNNRIIGVISSNEDNQTACIYYTGNEDDTLHITLSNNLIQNGSSGFLMENCNYVISTVNINKNIFDNQNHVGIKSDFYSHTGDGFIEITANTIQSNRAIDYGIYISSGTCKISFNTINIKTTVACTGIESMAVSTVDNNFISINANNNTVIPIMGYYSNNKSNLYFNSIYLHGNENAFSSCIHINDSNGQDNLYNNCLINLNSDRIIYSDISYSNFYMDYNNLYSTSSYFNFNDLVNTIGGNTHSVSLMPNFVSETDLHVQDLLLYRDGINIPEITTDIDGETRNNPPCIGGDEFVNPVFYAGKDTTFCYNDENIQYSGTHVFDIGIGYDSYEWSNGSDSSSVVIDSIYANTGNNENIIKVILGGNSYTDTVNILYDLPDAITETEYCYWTSAIELRANSGFENYLWNTGDIEKSITVNNTGNYSITVTDSYGCKAEESVHIDGASNYSPYNNYPADLGDDLSVCSSQSTQLLANKYTGNDIYANYSFIWNNSDTTQSITVDNSLTGSNTFIATVTLRANNLCYTTDTLTVTVQECTGFDEVGKSDLLIYPNPANNQFVIKGDAPESIKVLSYSGQVVIEKNIVQTPATVDVSSLKSGIYFIKFKYGKSIQVKKLIIRH